MRGGTKEAVMMRYRVLVGKELIYISEGRESKIIDTFKKS